MARRHRRRGEHHHPQELNAPSSAPSTDPHQVDAQTFDASLATAISDFGNFIFTAGYFQQGDSWLRDRDFSKNALTYDYSAQQADRVAAAALRKGPSGFPAGRWQSGS